MSQRISSRVQDLHCRFRAYGKNAREWMRKCALMLPEIDRERVWEKKGFGSIVEYAGKLAGMSRSAVEEALWVVGRVQDKPELLKVIEERGVSAVRPVAAIATSETAQFWAEKAMVMSKHTLQAYVHEVNLPPGRQTESEIMEITMQLPREIGEVLVKLKGQEEWFELMEELLELRIKKLEEEKPLEKKTAIRPFPPAIQRFVIERARGVCEVGVCRKKYTILHHVQRFALEQVHDPDRIIALCKAHERMVHLGLIEDETIKPREWKILTDADRHHPKYQIDQMVQKYRRPG